MVEAVALLFLGISLLVWSMGRHPIQIIQVREQGRMALSEVRSGSMHERIVDPVHLFQASLAETYPADTQVRRTVYVPAYPAIRIMSGRSRIDLATTLSIHNVSQDKPLLLEGIDYHNTEGELIQSYLEEPVALRPRGTIEMFVADEDRRGGTGANFVVDWAADGPISEPVIEAVMIGTQGNATYSFLTPAAPSGSCGRSEEPNYGCRFSVPYRKAICGVDGSRWYHVKNTAVVISRPRR
jgi:hypothetical protein